MGRMPAVAHPFTALQSTVIGWLRAATLLLVWATGLPLAHAQLTPLRIEITGVGSRQIPVAIAPFYAT